MVRRVKKPKSGGRSRKRYWSGAVTRHSNALNLESNVFRSSNPHRIALSLKRSAERSRRRKGSPYQSAMSMLSFFAKCCDASDSLNRSNPFNAWRLCTGAGMKHSVILLGVFI